MHFLTFILVSSTFRHRLSDRGVWNYPRSNANWIFIITKWKSNAYLSTSHFVACRLRFTMIGFNPLQFDCIFFCLRLICWLCDIYGMILRFSAISNGSGLNERCSATKCQNSETRTSRGNSFSSFCSSFAGDPFLLPPSSLCIVSFWTANQIGVVNTVG